MGFIGESEIGGLHTKRQQHQHQCHVGIDIGDDAVASACCRKLGGIEGYKQIVQESADDARQSVNSGI